MKHPIKIILKLKGDVKNIHSSLEGTYFLRGFVRNDYPVWYKEGNIDVTIWCAKNGTNWNIGIDDVPAIHSLENTSGPLKTNSWAYNNGSEFILSTDITVESGKNVIVILKS